MGKSKAYSKPHSGAGKGSQSNGMNGGTSRPPTTAHGTAPARTRPAHANHGSASKAGMRGQ